MALPPVASTEFLRGILRRTFSSIALNSKKPREVSISLRRADSRFCISRSESTNWHFRALASKTPTVLLPDAGIPIREIFLILPP